MAIKEILMIGYGAMGSALGETWKKVYSVTIIDPLYTEGLSDHKELSDDYQPDVIVLAVKPQLLSKVLPLYKRWFNQRSAIWVTLAAGVPLKFFENLLSNAQIVRAMPNLAVRFQQGITSLYSNSGPIKLIEDLFQSTGQILWLEDENQMDAVTAVAGSGPAYFYAMVEALAKAGQQLGLSPDNSMLLARQTAIGAGFMLHHLANHSATELRQQVTSPHGTTAAALEVLLNPIQGLTPLMQQTVKNAYQRAIELGQEQLKLTPV